MNCSLVVVIILSYIHTTDFTLLTLIAEWLYYGQIARLHLQFDFLSISLLNQLIESVYVETAVFMLPCHSQLISCYLLANETDINRKALLH